MIVYAVVYSECDTPSIFKDRQTAYLFMIEIIVYEMNYYSYEKDEISETLKELEESYQNNNDYFGAQWLDRTISCYQCEVM